TATGMTINYGPAVEVDWLPQKGLFASFQATPTSGPPNTTVQFTDTSFSSHSAGVLAWTYDFGDGTPTSNLQNPSHLYKCGTFSPKLTVLDAVHPMHTKQYTDLINVGVVEADFTASGTFGVSPFSVTFTDTSTGGPSKWLWDFGDGSAPSTDQNPTHIYVKGGKFTVTMTCKGMCNKAQEVKTDLIEVCAPNSPNSGSITTLFTGGNGLTSPGCGNLFDATVINPDGLKITDISVNSRAAATTPIDIEVWITPGTYIGNDNLPGVWVMVSKGAANSAGSLVPTKIDVDDFYLSAGKYGVYIIYNAGGIHYTNGNGTNQSYQNCDLKLDLGTGKNVRFSGGMFNPRVWNGSLHYDKNDIAAHGRFGYGCPGSNAAIGDLTMSADPKLGGTGNITVTGTPNVAAAPGFLFVGINKQLMDLTPLGMATCWLHTDMLLTLGIVSLNGTATLPFGIPNQASLVGAQALMQGAIVDAGANTLGVSMTNGLSVRIGN
ncbi:MAG: PKD domain-containing protein, partial [Planctomycetota bacterium]|nr:PKD domain-containing protein [Planctomycetota bacterium]